MSTRAGISRFSAHVRSNRKQHVRCRDRGTAPRQYRNADTVLQRRRGYRRVLRHFSRIRPAPVIPLDNNGGRDHLVGPAVQNARFSHGFARRTSPYFSGTGENHSRLWFCVNFTLHCVMTTSHSHEPERNVPAPARYSGLTRPSERTSCCEGQEAIMTDDQSRNASVLYHKSLRSG